MREFFPYTGGRDYIRTSDSNDWLEWFDNAIDGHARSALVAPADNLEALLTYDFKTSRRLVDANGKALQPAYYSEQTRTLRPAEQIILVQDALAGLPSNLSFHSSPNQEKSLK